MPSGLIPAHYGAPRHFSLPSIHDRLNQKKERVVAGHCDKYNLFYIRDKPRISSGVDNPNEHCAFMRYKRVKDNVIQLDGMVVPQTMRGRGVSSALARQVLDHMTSKNIYVDVRCPVTKEYIKENRYAQYVRQMVNPEILTKAKTTLN